MSYTIWILLTATLVGINCGLVGTFLVSVSYTHLTLPTTPYV